MRIGEHYCNCHVKIGYIHCDLLISHACRIIVIYVIYDVLVLLHHYGFPREERGWCCYLSRKKLKGNGQNLQILLLPSWATISLRSSLPLRISYRQCLSESNHELSFVNDLPSYHIFIFHGSIFFSMCMSLYLCECKCGNIGSMDFCLFCLLCVSHCLQQGEIHPYIWNSKIILLPIKWTYLPLGSYVKCGAELSYIWSLLGRPWLYAAYICNFFAFGEFKLLICP